MTLIKLDSVCFSIFYTSFHSQTMRQFVRWIGNFCCWLQQIFITFFEWAKMSSLATFLSSKTNPKALKMLGLQIFQCEKNPAEFYCLNHLVSCGCDGFLQHNHNFHTTWSIVVFNSANKKSLNFILFIKDFCI